MLTLLASLATALVVCAPGYPGSRAEAQPAMDAFARVLAAQARLPAGALTASYEETDAGGLRALERPESGVLLATLPFFLAHEAELHLTARLLAVPQGAGSPLQRWTLVAGKQAALPLAGFTVQSSAGEERFVRAAAPGLAPDAKAALAGGVLSGLRKAASGEKLALLLDGPQATALGKLPFAEQLTALATSAPLPIAIVATVGKRLDEKSWQALETALQGAGKEPAAREALDGVQMSAFVPLDPAALVAARALWQKAR